MKVTVIVQSNNNTDLISIYNGVNFLEFNQQTWLNKHRFFPAAVVYCSHLHLAASGNRRRRKRFNHEIMTSVDKNARLPPAAASCNSMAVAHIRCHGVEKTTCWPQKSVFATTLESFYVRSWLKLLCLLCYQSPVFNKILLTKRYMMLKIFKPSCFCFDNWVLLFKHQRLKRRIKQLHILRTQVFREICRHTSKMSRCAEFRFIRWNCQIGGYTLQNKCFIEQFSSSSSPKE